MNFADALILINANRHLIGKLYLNKRIDDLLIMPVNEHERNLFMRLYINGFNAQQSIAPFIEHDVEVFALILKEDLIRHRDFFPFINILQLPPEMGVINPL
ncbi:MAG: hypothetical protein FWF42_03435 [Streptococcaceae bacterium]|nr:hypothetical protein [Streptococcaceae bacterium]